MELPLGRLHQSDRKRRPATNKQQCFMSFDFGTRKDLSTHILSLREKTYEIYPSDLIPFLNHRKDVACVAKDDCEAVDDNLTEEIHAA
jgi:hypothetical protein